MLKTATFSSELKAVVKFNSFNLVCKKKKNKKKTPLLILENKKTG